MRGCSRAYERIGVMAAVGAVTGLLALALVGAFPAPAGAAARPSPETRVEALPDSDPGTVRKADLVVVVKHERKLYLLSEGKVLETYAIKLGRNPKGPKVKAHDGRTPEGTYVIDRRDPQSLFTLALHISYPDAQDRERARRLHVDPGGDIEIHGEPFVTGAISPEKLRRDWTDGCIALSNADMQRVWDRVDDGTPIEIRP
jgi:murein L,D-transpeptidase YafK